ncbi:GNAT family N-acetyltransferase [Paenibacillus sp. MAHUQ-46]|uniref:GNAT family N-acetyltransferase n=2 Tax=Paenibacillus TaxID=44249 RepID=A0A934J3B5_9BACL|nr:GNAT family N-acetyltransferase [Paenibacillus roseus]
MWPDKDLSFVQLEEDVDGHHFGLYVGNVLVTVISLFVEDNRAQFRKFATLRQEQGKGYGSKLLEFTLQEAQRRGAVTVWCNARASKVAFYRKFGLQPTDSVFRKAGVDYVILEKALI